MQTISSRQNPIVGAFRELADVPDASGTRLLLDGVHLVRDARAAALEFEVIAVASSRLTSHTEEGEMARSLESAGESVLAVTDAAFAAMSPVRAPSGIVAVARRTPSTAEDICRHQNGFVLVALDVQDPGNLGSLIRAGEAGGATGVLVCGASASPFSWKAVRGSMGSVLRLPVAAGLTADAAIRQLRTHGGRIVATAPHGGLAPDAVEWRGPIGLLLGGEGPGLSEPTLAQADELVTIPMASPVESLNVAVATAILVYAARRQRL